MAEQVDPQHTPFTEDLVPQTSFRLVDETIVAWLQTLTFRQQHPRVNVAWISRQFAQQHELLNKDSTKQGATMPWVTLSLMGIQPAIDRRVVANIVALGRSPQLWDPKGGGSGCGTVPDSTQLDADGDNRMNVDLTTTTPDEVYVLPFPLPFDLQYQIDFFTKTRMDLRMLTSSFLTRFSFTTETYLKMCVPGLGNQLLTIQLDRVDDTSDLETGEAERQLRHTATITARAWIYRAPVRKKTIRDMSVLVFDASGNLLNDPAFIAFYCDPSHYTFSGSEVVDVDESTSPYTPPERTIAIFNFQDGALSSVGPPGV